MNLSIGVWLFWDCRSRYEVASGVNWETKGASKEGWWCLRIVMALSTTTKVSGVFGELTDLGWGGT